MRPIVKNAIVIVVLVLAFISTALISIWASANLTKLIANSNMHLNDMVNQAKKQGVRVYYSEFKPAGSSIRVNTISDFLTLCTEHAVDEAYWQWSRMDFPLTIVSGKIWFTEEQITYYLETYA